MSKDIWQKFLEDNENAFSDLYRIYSKELFAYGVKIGFDEDACKDAIQDVFYSIYVNKTKLTHIENIEFYLMQCVRNRLFDMHNHQVKINQINYDDIIIQREDNVVEKIINKEKQLQIENAISQSLKKLSPTQRKIVYYHYQLNLELQEITTILKMSPAAVRKSLYRALQKLRASSSQFFHIFLSFF